MTNLSSRIAYWVALYNAEVAAYNGQVAAATAQYNARFVNNAGTGPLWSAQDAADVALYNAEVAAYNASQAALAAMTTNYNNEVAAYNASQAALAAQIAATAAAAPPASADVIGGTVLSNVFNNSGSNIVCQVIVDRTGYWAAGGQLKRNTVPSGDTNLYLKLNFNGAQIANTQLWMPGSAPNPGSGGGVLGGPSFLTAGAHIDFVAQSDLSANTNCTPELKAYFMPTAAYPR